MVQIFVDNNSSIPTLPSAKYSCMAASIVVPLLFAPEVYMDAQHVDQWSTSADDARTRAVGRVSPTRHYSDSSASPISTAYIRQLAAVGHD